MSFNPGRSSNRGGGGGGGFRGGGGGGRGRSSSRGGGGGGRGRSSGRDGGRGGRGGDPSAHGKLNLCRNFTKTGQCQYGDNCYHYHVVQLHAQVNAAPKPSLDSIQKQQQQQSRNNYKGNYNNSNGNSPASVSSITVWEQPNNAPFKIFTGSHDGYWRLWNTAGGQFTQEFESNMNGKVNECLVRNNFLFCGFEAVCPAVPNVPVGMTHAWNLQNPSQPPLELQVQPAPTQQPPNPAAVSLPYAHNSAVTAVHMAAADPTNPTSVQIATGSHDGSIHLWAYREPTFALAKRLVGHAREVTGLVLLPAQHLLWSCGIDCCIRIWNTTTGDCQYCITQTTPGKSDSPLPPPTTPGGTAPATGIGHSHAVTALLSFESHPGGAGGTFILSSSLDGTVKAWNAVTGECVASESHSEGVVCMALARDGANNQLLLLGMESGGIQCRNLVQTAKVAAFQLLFTLGYHHGVQHNGAVKCLTAGPSATFYSGGTDGMMNVFSFVGDLELN